MAKTKGSLFSQEAHGAIGDALSFSSWKGKTRVKFNAKPKNPRSNSQQANRSFMTEAISSWRTLSTGEKAIWEGWKV
jgi:hypothetical protein